MNWLVAIIFAALLQGNLLLLALIGRKEGRSKTNAYFRLFIGLLLAKLTGKLLFLFYPTSLFLMKFLLVGDVIIFLLPVALFLYLRRLTGIVLLERYPIYVHFVPAVVYLISTIPFLILSDAAFQTMVQSSRLYFLMVESSAIVWNLFYLSLNQKMVIKLIQTSDQFLSFSNHKPYVRLLNVFYAVMLACWIFNFVISNFIYPYAFAFWVYQFIWLLLSSLIFTLTYFAITQPEIFQIPESNSTQTTVPLLQTIEPTQPIAYEQLLQLMTIEKPYLDPELTLAKLAALCQLHTHELSKLINQQAGKNFLNL